MRGEQDLTAFTNKVRARELGIEAEGHHPAR
jgi:hypothetical protein